MTVRFEPEPAFRVQEMLWAARSYHQVKCPLHLEEPSISVFILQKKKTQVKIPVSFIKVFSPSWVAVMSCSSLSFLSPMRSMASSMESLLISLITFTVLKWGKCIQIVKQQKSLMWGTDVQCSLTWFVPPGGSVPLPVCHCKGCSRYREG